MRYERPISFAQIHDAMRDARNNAGIVRTNEELRTLIKQAINSGMLERSGKGNRVTYRLAQSGEPAETLETPELEGQVFAPPAAELEGQVLTPPAAELEGQVLAPPAVEPPTFFTPEAAAQAELAQHSPDVVAEAEPPTVITAEEPSAVAPAPQKRARSRRKPAAEKPAAEKPAAEKPVAEAPKAEPATAQKRSRPRKAAGNGASATPAADAPAVLEEAAPAKPKRSRRKKTENTEA